MKTIELLELCTPELTQGAIYNDEFTGFHDDYLALHCLIKKYLPKSFFEVGTNMGTGTNIICNANPAMKVFSLDLPEHLSDLSAQSPVSEGKGFLTGSKCRFPFTQIYADSMSYNYQQHVIEGWFIDGEHDFSHPLHESNAAFKSKAKIIIWHDTDISEVSMGILSSYNTHGDNYELIRVLGTRISYAVRI